MKCLLWILLFASLLLNIWLYGCRTRQPHETDTDTVVVTDTIMVRVPVVRDSVVIRYVTEYLPVVHTDTIATVDSVPVMIPIAQKVYRDSTYTAWVSGYHASLDSIALYQPTITIRRKPRKWSVGLSAGYGMTPQGLQPYVGVGVTYRLW